jgi:hypothetical protein
MSQREVSITGNNNTRVKVTGQEELLVKVNSIQLGTGDPATSTTVGADTGLDVNIIGGTLPLPTGAATEATLLDVKTSVQLLDDCVGTDGATAPTKSLVVAGVTASGFQQTIEVNASGHVNISDGGGSITVDGGTGVSRTPTILRTSASGATSATAYSVSFASVGTVNATVGGFALKPGETINFDAGAINNTLGAVTYNATAVGAELLIITLT